MVRSTSVLVTGVRARIFRNFLADHIETWTSENGATEDRVDTATLPADLYDQVATILGEDVPDYIVLYD